MIDSFEEVFLKRMKEIVDDWKTALAIGPVSDVQEIFELRGKVHGAERVVREFKDIIQGYKDE